MTGASALLDALPRIAATTANIEAGLRDRVFELRATTRAHR